uniref:Vitellogenin domain-containing protein n=1 Tax=Pygocentrus nattereri TaxID=42514 RepID=A0AAR2JKF9_PYGNA
FVLCFLLIDAQDEETPCLLDKRYRSFHKYEYLYEAESLNSLNGAINGPRASCKVEIEVPGTCHYVVHMKECTLSEVTGADADGNPVFRAAAGADTFKIEMEKNPLKVIVEGDNDIKLFPEDGELINILNIKRGIISALAVPVLEEERNKRMPTVFGLCKTDYTVNAREDIATDVTITRDLSRCDNFRPIKDHTSPLALITGMHYPLAQLFRSKQTCNYKFDNQQKHMTSGDCTETHLLVPFSHKGRYGVMNVGKQTVSLLGVTEHNERVFDYSKYHLKESHVDMSPNQDADAILTILRELAGLSQTTHGNKRAHLAQRLVAVIRKSNADTLSAALPEALDISRSLTYQALFQCGTPACSSAMLKVLRTIGSTTAEIDAAVYAMGLVPNPSRALVKEMLEMARFKPTKLIYYATSNAVRRLYKAEGRVTPEIEAVADYFTEETGDCTGDQEHIYLTLRVIGNMAAAVGAASPDLKSAVIKCINQPAASPKVQQAAIQVFRLTPVPEEGRSDLMQVLLNGNDPVQKRIAAYLILMKDPQPAELDQLAAALRNERNLQAKSFFISHITNILSSTAPETKELRQKILDALQGNEVEKVMDPTKFSRHYKIGSLVGNMIFEKANKLPKEVMLEMTLNAFGYDIDMFEVGVEGKGLEPTVEALFGPRGFFPDTAMKTIFFAMEKMPSQVNEVLSKIIPLKNHRKKRQASQNIIRDISQNVEKLIKDLKAQDTPEAMLYLRLLGAELGYLQIKDMEELAYSVAKVVENLLKMFPTDFIKGLFSSVDNELFLHYIFMDNEFYLPTGPGVPLRVALSGTFAPGVKGGLKIARDMSEIAFMPSVGVEFVAEIGAHLPDYVHSGLEMHTNIYHESGLSAKVALAHNQIKVTIPAPDGSSKLLSITNTLLSVAGDDINIVPAMEQRVNAHECRPLFSGLKQCSSIDFSDAWINDASPYFPLSGDSKYEIELRPTGEVSEYTATIKYTNEDMVDKVTVDVEAEGTLTKATAMMMFNRKDYTVSADLQIPEYLNVGLRIVTADPHSITIDLLSNDVSQASLVGLAKIDTEKAMLQVQLLVPSLQADAKITTSLKYADDLTLEFESDLRLPETTSVQKLILTYDDEKIEADIKSDVSTGTKTIAAEFDNIKAQISDLLNQQIGQTEMKVLHVLTSAVEATNSYLEASKIPYVENLRVPSFSEIALPERLFLYMETGANYHFGKDYYTITFPMPLGGKSSKDLNFPPALTTPNLAVPQLGLQISSIEVPLPEILVPETFTVSLPSLGMAEVSGKLSSNLYDLEATASAGRQSSEQRSYSASVEVIGTCPVDILSLRVQGSARLYETSSGTLKAEVKSAVYHKLIDASVSIFEEVNMVKEISIKSSSKFDATGPLGIEASLEHTGQVEISTEEISGDSNLKGTFVTGPVSGGVSLTQSLALFPFRPKARIQSDLKVDSTLLQAQNTFTTTYANGELSVLSNTDAFGDVLTHTAEVTIRKSTFAVKSDAKALALGLKIQNIAEVSVSAGDVNIKFETTTDHPEDYIRSLITATLNADGLAVNSNAAVKLAEHTATHKASLALNKNGLATNGTTFLNSPLVLKNTFSGVLDSTKASFSVKTKSEFVGIDLNNDISMSATTSTVDLVCKSQGSFDKYLQYVNDVHVHGEPYSAAVNINNDLTILAVKINNEAMFKAEPYKADLTGTLKLALDADELKHTYEISYADLIATAKCSTTAKLMGAHMSHDTEMEIAGLGVRINNNANFNSQPVRFTTTLQATAVPFSFNLNALANGDGELNLFGKQSAQVYTKFLLKAEPLAFAHSHECRVSTKHELNSDVIIETNFDKKVDTVLTPFEQLATIRVKSKINNNEISQDVSAYNNPERIGVEASGVFISGEIQDVSLSGFLKYEKNTESHAINLPFIESLPEVLENIKITAVTIAEDLQNYIQREDFIVEIQTLLQHISDFVTDLNLEERIIQLKNDLITFAQDCPITVEHLEASVMKLRSVAQKVITELGTRVSEVEGIMKEIVANGDVQKLTEKLKVLTEEFDINTVLLAVIEAFKDMVNLIAVIPTDDVNKMGDTLKQLIIELDIAGSCKEISDSVREFFVKYEVDKKIEAFLDKIVDLIKQFKIDQTVQGLINTLKSVEIPVTGILNKALTYLKTTEIKEIIEDLNTYLDAFIQTIQSFDYNAFVNEVNLIITKYTTKLNNLIASYELPQKLEAVREFINYALSSVSAFFKELRAFKVTDVIKTLKDTIDSGVLNDIKELAGTFKQKITDMDLREQILQALEFVKDIYTEVLTEVTDDLDDIFDITLGDEPIVTELKQIIEGIVDGLKTAELEFPSFTVPLTDLALPSMKFSLHQLQEIELPTQFEIPQFTILGSYTVPPVSITCEYIKQRLMELIDLIVNFEIEILTNNSYFEEISLNYLPDFSAMTLPEISIPDISFPAIPTLGDKYALNVPLPLPKIQLPKIPTAVVVPTFGKLYSEIRLRTPIYTLRTSAEIQNSTGNEQMHHFTAFLTSIGESSEYPVLNYNLDCTARIGVPRMSRLIIAETLKFIHSALTVEHQASVTFYGLSAQATAQTIMKATTTPYKADIVNRAFFAVEGGMSASLDTTYKHKVDIPFLSMTNEATLTQSAVAIQKDTTISVTVGQIGTGKVNLPDYSEEASYKSDLRYTMDLQNVKFTFTEDFDSATLKIKDTLNVNAVMLSHIDFNGQIETKSSYIKNSLLVASGRAHLGDRKVELEATHDTELVGPLSGTLSNALNIMVRPVEIVIDFQNKGNTKITLIKSLSAKIDLQNDYSVIVNSRTQRINTAALVRFNQYKYGYNFTIDNKESESGIYATANGETDLEFLTVPLSIPEIPVPMLDFSIPAISDLNLYEHSGLKHLLITTKQAIDVDGKIVYQKSKFPPIIDLGFISVPAIGNLNSEVSFKSSIFNLNANAGIHGDDLVIRVAATSTSVHKPLKAKLEGTSGLTLKRGVKLATTVSLENAHFSGNHDSTLTLNTENLEAAVAVSTFAKTKLPILTIDANHNFKTDTKTHLKAESILDIKYTYDLPIIKAVGKGDAEHTFKLDGAFSSISVESTAKGKIDGTLLQAGIVNGALDNGASIYMDSRGLRSNLKTDGNIYVNYADLKVEFDVNENLDMEAALARVYTVLNIASNNEVNIAALNTKGKHAVKATIDLAPLTADVEFDLSQPSNFGDLTMYEKTVVDLPKGMISYSTKIVSPIYTTNTAIEVEGDAPVFKVALKSYAISPFVLLGYNLDSNTTMENDVLSATAKAFLEHNDFIMDFNNVITLRQISHIEPSHTLNVDITSPTFTDVNLRYAARRDGVSTSVSTPSAGFLGFQLHGKIPSEMYMRLYGRYASALENDIDIFTAKVDATGDEKISVQATYNLEAPKEMILGLQARLPFITSSITNFGEKYGICSAVEGLKTTIVSALTEVFTAASSHAPELSQLSILFRNVVVQYQKAIQNILNAAARFLRETQIKLPGMEETTLPEICKKIKSNVVKVVQEIITAISDNFEAYFAPIIKTIGTVELILPSGGIMTGDQIYVSVRTLLRDCLTRTAKIVEQLESLDMILDKLGDTLQEVVEKAQEIVDNIRSEVIDAVALYFNIYYTSFVTLVKGLIEKVDALLTIDQLNAIVEKCMESVLLFLNELKRVVSDILPAESGALIRVQDGRLELELPFPFQP